MLEWTCPAVRAITKVMVVDRAITSAIPRWSSGTWQQFELYQGDGVDMAAVRAIPR